MLYKLVYDGRNIYKSNLVEVIREDRAKYLLFFMRVVNLVIYNIKPKY